MRETVSHNKWYVCRCPGSSHKYRRIRPTRRRRPQGIATCTSCFSCADLSCISDSCSGKKPTCAPPARFFLSARKFATSPSTSFACSVSVHPFPRTLDRPPGALPFILNLAALVFRLFGMYSVASAIVLLGIQCIIAATGITIHALGRRTLGAQMGFFTACLPISRSVIFHLGRASGTRSSTAFFLHLIELAWRATARLRNDRPSHCQDDDCERAASDLRLDRRKYPTSRKVSKEEMKGIHLQPDRFHGGWNYVIRPHQSRDRQRMEIG